MFGLAILSCGAKAATIDLWVFTDGRWAYINPNRDTGGRREWNGVYWVTDRAARGELVQAVISTSTAAESSNPVICSASLSSTAGSVGLGGAGKIMTTGICFTVPLDPNWDNNCVNIRTVSGVFTKPLRVGRR
jgi:hypothetical protein